MGLFSNKNNYQEYMDRYNNIESGNYSEIDYSNFIDNLRYRTEGHFNTKFDDYYMIRAFLISISNEDIINSFMPKVPFKNDDLSFWPKLMTAWTISEALNKNNVFRSVLNNTSLINMLNIKKEEFRYLTIRALYEMYQKCIIDHDSAKDTDSVIFNNSFYRFRDDNDIKKIIDYDVILYNQYPDKRKDIIYMTNSDGSLYVREPYSIEDKLSEYNITL